MKELLKNAASLLLPAVLIGGMLFSGIMIHKGFERWQRGLKNLDKCEEKNNDIE